MAEKTRYNKVIELLEEGKPVFCSGLVWNGNLDDLSFVADSDYDMVIIEMEHQGFSFNDLQISLQFLLSRKRIADKAGVQAALEIWPEVAAAGSASILGVNKHSEG